MMVFGGISMDITAALIIGSALAMDAFAVSVSCGSSDRNKNHKMALITAFSFGLFQMMMPIIGWSVGKVGSSVIEGFDEYIAFGILVFLGAKMIFDSRKSGEISGTFSGSLKSVLILAAATSIDALTAGIVLPSTVHAQSMKDMIITVSVIGLITFVLSLIGYFMGKLLNKVNPMAAEAAGGMVLIILGIKSLF